MKEYASKEAFIAEIRKTANLFVKEFDEISEEDKDLCMEDGERTPYKNLAYQLGWMALIQKWEQDEKDGNSWFSPK